MRLIFLAPPGAGKETQAKYVEKEYKIPHISTGDIFREALARETPLGREAKAFMDRGELVPDELVLKIVGERLQQNDSKDGWILDGFPRNQEQAIALDKMLEEMNQVDYKVIYLDVQDEVLIERLAGRFQEKGRKDDKPEVVPNRLKVYKEQTAPLIDLYSGRNQLIFINGNQAVEVVALEIQSALKPEASDYPNSKKVKKPKKVEM